LSAASSTFDLTGRTALVTGAGRGLGFGIAAALADAGCAIAAVARSEDQLGGAVRELTGRGARAVAVPWDVGDGSTADDLVTEAEEAVGPVDVLVHAAGIQVRAPAAELDLEGWDRVHGIHLRAAFALARGVRERLVARGAGGSLVFIGSLTSRLGIPGTVAYGSAKTGVVGLMRNLAVEWARDGIRANAILPGYFHTALTDDLMRDASRADALRARIPMGRLGEAADLGGAAVFLASDASAYVTGQTVAVDGGWLAA
jgi:NAD(P)-dependent dehydrogenase (short-subunit alcohol dehydrogenase family)